MDVPLLANRRNAGLKQFYIVSTFRLRSLIDGYSIIHFLFYFAVYILISHVSLSTSSRCLFCRPLSECTPPCVFRPVFFPQSFICLLPHVSSASFVFPVFLCCFSCFQPLCSQSSQNKGLYVSLFLYLSLFLFLDLPQSVFVSFIAFTLDLYGLQHHLITDAFCSVICLLLSVFSPTFPKHNPVSV